MQNSFPGHFIILLLFFIVKNNFLIILDRNISSSITVHFSGVCMYDDNNNIFLKIEEHYKHQKDYSI